jgi:endonuclease/exonuclease/phosphatase family metal-dependent hydrolase
MHTYYKRKKSPGAMVRLLDAVAIVITVAAAVALLCAYLGRWVNPNAVWVFAFAGMAAPVLYLLNLVLALYWIVRWRRWALLSAAVLLAGAGWVSLFFKPVLERHKPEVKSEITLMSYNVEGFVSGLEGTAEFIRSQQPDILCIQEFHCPSAARQPRIDSLIGLPYAAHSYVNTSSTGGGQGIAIYSRWRIIDRGEIRFEGSANSAMWADILAADDTLRIFNCHLQSTSVSRSDVEYVEDFVREESRARTRNIASKLRRNFRTRAMQADTLAPLIRNSPHPTIVCGDFNDTPMSYAYTRIRGPLHDAFAESGTGAPNTYKGLFNMLRIDYILLPDNIRAVSYDNPSGPYSDHKPVVVGTKIQ